MYALLITEALLKKKIKTETINQDDHVWCNGIYKFVHLNLFYVICTHYVCSLIYVKERRTRIQFLGVDEDRLQNAFLYYCFNSAINVDWCHQLPNDKFWTMPCPRCQAGF